MEPHYLGSKGGIERTWLPSNLDYHVIPAAKWRRYWSVQNLLTPFIVLWAVVASYQLLGKLRPQVVFSTGGYVTLPVVLASWLRRIPVVIHEQTRVMGLSNRMASRLASKVLLGFPPATGQARGAKTVVVGNPVRAELFVEVTASEAKRNLGFDAEAPLILIMGGAQGCHFFNITVDESLSAWLAESQIYLATGDNGDFERLILRQTGLTPLEQRRIKVTKYLGKNLGLAYRAADLVISRAGAGSVSELLALGKRALLVPLPASAGGEQQANAAYAKARGRVTVLDQTKAAEGVLLAEATKLMGVAPADVTPTAVTQPIVSTEPTKHIVDCLKRYGA